ncbi:MAG: CRISPR-associated endonuclease Cas2 [Deltaproteobacteria bacterium]|jgi:CRISPR-associated protein Cas2|nr:CRISPR-associated endonuclease Cas2 [Deltaproteobacteria bacterium]
MAETKLEWMVIYDVRDPKRWRKVYKLLRGYGQRLQYSVFKCQLSDRQLQRLRWQLEQRLDAVDSLLLVGLCGTCVERVVARNRPESWGDDGQGVLFKIV